MKIGGERFLREDIKNIKVAVIGDIMPVSYTHLTLPTILLV